MDRKKGVLVFLVACILLLCGCVSEEQKTMYDKDELIAKEGDTYYFVLRAGGEERLLSDGKSEISFSEFYGSETLCSLDVDSRKEVAFDFVSDIESGQFKVVVANLSSEPKEVITICEGTAEGSKDIVLEPGKYVVKIVGKKAKGSIKVSM